MNAAKRNTSESQNDGRKRGGNNLEIYPLPITWRVAIQGRGGEDLVAMGCWFLSDFSTAIPARDLETGPRRQAKVKKGLQSLELKHAFVVSSREAARLVSYRIAKGPPYLT